MTRSKSGWMRVLERLTLVFAVVAVLSPFAAILLPGLLQRLNVPQESDIVVSNAWVRPVLVETSGQEPMAGMESMDSTDSVTGAYLVIENRGSAADRLLSITSDAATTVEIHETQIDDSGVARMRPQPDGIEIPARSTVEVRPGGYHLMLTGIKQTLELGQTIDLSLTFASGATFEVSAVVANYAPTE